MAPNARGSVGSNGGVINSAEVEARGRGTKEDKDTYDRKRRLWSEYRVFFTGVMFLTRLPCPSWTDHHPAFLM
ncbi:hypothetical protein DUNSADRAFT_17627 [Dunaliella salina]|uniref:Uncharacterized protein n=1 Tax=Dunaliella salina TaxID=3046 RepID=A0ABQ7GZW0_DUNSA|nr:hypothetical protein DUNSADRAFT_17627 [Dunaliella salina]|eukprot:KAF5840143.1 hypothetical protein DUNSADRAFT_17627 [Dunaliella salina]